MRRAALCTLLTWIAACGEPRPPDAGDVLRADAAAAAPDSDRGDAPAGPDAPGPDVGSPARYEATPRAIMSGGVSRAFLAAVPTPTRAMLPLVIALHGDGGNGAGLRAGFAIEAAAAGGAVVLYPDALGGTFEYYTYAGREREAQFVRDLIDDAVAAYAIDRGRVFLTGFSGGATMANALNCWLGAGVIRGVGINAGTLYPTMPEGMPMRADFGYTAAGGVDCAGGLAAAMFVWGAAEAAGPTSLMNGEGTRDNYRATLGCAAGTEPLEPAPCVRYQGCTRAVAWCAISGMGHTLWPRAPEAVWRFFAGLP